MPSAFTRTLRSLELDSYRPAFVLGMVAVPLLAGWVAWAVLSKAPVYAVTTHARTEIDGSVIPVDVLEQGRVVASHLQLGERVTTGDVLLELDATLDKAHLEELKVRQVAVGKRLEPLRKQRDALLAVFETQRRLGGANAQVASVRAAAAQSEAERGQELAEISSRLAKAGLNSKVDELQSLLAAQRRSDSAREGVAEVSRAAATQALEVQRMALQNVEFSRALVDAESELIQVGAQIRTVETVLERRTVRALVTGYLGDVAPVTVGMTVTPGRPLATIIPDGKIRMVAYFPPTEAVGRVKLGQRAFLRFDAFPWTQFGIAEGDVTSVGVEPRSSDGREGGIRVEIAIDRGTTTRTPLQHGMPASVEVLVDHATPWQMLMRSVGGISTPRSESETTEPKAAPSP